MLAPTLDSPPRFGVAVEIKRTHLTPVGVQVVLLAYWAAHWLPLRGRLLSLVWLVPAALLADYALVRWRTGASRLSLAALPVVLSATLYTNYPLSQSLWMGLVVGVALLSKALIRRRGRHVFNPSALGLSVLAYLTLLGVAPLQDVAHAFSAAPNMVELILLLALVAQLRVPVVLVTLGSVVGLGVWALVHGWVLPGSSGLLFTPGWAPVTLVLVLLLTDPATIPESPAGRLLFGVVVGALMGAWGDVLVALGRPDFFGKVLAVPMGNAMVPWLQRAGARLDPRLPWLAPEFNRRHVALWMAVGVALLLVDGKPSHYTSNMFVYSRARPALLKAGGDGVPTCVENPVYCQPFSFVHEARCWAAEWGGGTRCGDRSPLDQRALRRYSGHHWSAKRVGKRPTL